MKDKNRTFLLLYIPFLCLKNNSRDKTKKIYTRIEAITMSRWEWYNVCSESSLKKRSEDYKSHKERLIKKIMSTLNKNVKGIQNSINHLKLSTPLTVWDPSNYQKVEMYGLNHDNRRFGQRILQPRTNINNLFSTAQPITTVKVTFAFLSGFFTEYAIEKIIYF
tara:strand:+ start:62 stop:553 length:492 start_codon:yes stop_codon:yes gene_type:complete